MLALALRFSVYGDARRALVGAFIAIVFCWPGHALAMGYYPVPGYCQEQGAARGWWAGTQPVAPQPPNFSQKMQNYILNDIYRDRIVEKWWKDELEPAFKAMTAQLNANEIHHAGLIGGFYDGLSVIRAQQTMQALEAGAYKNYTPGEGLCRVGTMTRSLAASDDRRDTTVMALASMAQARQLGTRGGGADTGMGMDRKARLDQFSRLYCDPADHDGKLAPLCGNGAPQSRPDRFNKDINIARTLLGSSTLNIDFSNDATTADEEDVLALASNLYGHDVMTRFPKFATSSEADNQKRRLQYLTLRQMVAFRNVAQYSFQQAVGRRALGAGGAFVPMGNALRELGLTESEAVRYLANDTTTPSYNAQMEILTKKIYQNPNFYTNLIDKPANVDRQIAAMQAVGLMQDRDVYQSMERQEMLMSLLLELKVRREQANAERLSRQTGLTR
jgi:hypothetical protein